MTNEEYFRYLDNPLSKEEKQALINDGWEFINEQYIHIPNDWDGCFADGIRAIRRVSLDLQYPSIYRECNGRCKDVLEKALGL